MAGTHTATAATPLAQESEDRVIGQLTALANASRLNIFRELVRVFDCCNSESGLAAGELANRMDIPAPTLSFHLKELHRAGLVTSERRGRSIIYQANLGAIRSLVDFLLEDCCSERTAS